MPFPHLDIAIIKRSSRQSAACQSGERLFSEYDQKQKYYSHKSEIVHMEIMLPPMPRRSTQTETSYGTPLKLPRSNGTPSLPAESSLPFQRKSHRNDTPTLPELLSRYMDLRREERSGWTAIGQLKGAVPDFNKVMAAIDFLQKQGISSVESLDKRLDEISQTAQAIRKEMKKSERYLDQATAV